MNIMVKTGELREAFRFSVGGEFRIVTDAAGKTSVRSTDGALSAKYELPSAEVLGTTDTVAISNSDKTIILESEDSEGLSIISTDSAGIVEITFPSGNTERLVRKPLTTPLSWEPVQTPYQTMTIAPWEYGTVRPFVTEEESKFGHRLPLRHIHLSGISLRASNSYSAIDLFLSEPPLFEAFIPVLPKGLEIAKDVIVRANGKVTVVVAGNLSLRLDSEGLEWPKWPMDNLLPNCTVSQDFPKIPLAERAKVKQALAGSHALCETRQQVGKFPAPYIWNLTDRTIAAMPE